MAAQSPHADASAWCRPLFEGTQLSMLVCDPVSQEILDANDATLTLLGHTRDTLLGMHLPELYAHDADDGTGLQPETCRLHSHVRHIAGARGEIHHAILQRCAIEYGGRDAVLVVLQDVTRHVEAEVQLRDTQNELLRAQSLALIGNWIWDAASDSHVTSSPEGYRIMGFRPDETPERPAFLDGPFPPLKMPTLVIWGLGDQALLPVQLEGLEAMVPDLTLKTLEGVGHFAPWEAPEKVTGAMREWLADHGG